MLMVGVAGQAMAYFEQPSLIRVVYDRGGEKEIVTDMGKGFNYQTPSTANFQLTANPFNLSDLGLADYSNVYVSYFAMATIGYMGYNAFWLSGPEGGQTSESNRWQQASPVVTTIWSLNSLTGLPQNIVSQETMGSYGYNTETPAFGTMKGFIPARNVDQNLGSFNAEGMQYVDQYLYYYAPNPATGKPGLNVAQIRTYENGTTEINPVPIPAAVYLLGSGLLALVGIRRKTNLEA